RVRLLRKRNLRVPSRVAVMSEAGGILFRLWVFFRGGKRVFFLFLNLRKFFRFFLGIDPVEWELPLCGKELSVEPKTYGERQNIKSKAIPLPRHSCYSGRLGSCCLGRDAHHTRRLRLSHYAFDQHGRRLSVGRRQRSAQPLG